MPSVEIERPSVSFTDEAQRALQNSLMRIERRIRAKAADHAIKVRGTPSEVTASDIEKAYRELIAFSNRYVVPSRIENGPKHWRKATSLRLLATVYTWIGALTAVSGIVYPFVRTKLLDPSVRFTSSTSTFIGRQNSHSICFQPGPSTPPPAWQTPRPLQGVPSIASHRDFW